MPSLQHANSVMFSSFYRLTSVLLVFFNLTFCLWQVLTSLQEIPPRTFPFESRYGLYSSREIFPYFGEEGGSTAACV